MKRLDPAEWPRLVLPGSRVFLAGGASVPFALVDSLLAQATHLKDIEVVHIHGLGETPWIDPRFEGVLRTNSFFLTPAVREAVERGQAVSFTPTPQGTTSNFRSLPAPPRAGNAPAPAAP